MMVLELEEGAKPATYRGGTSALYRLLSQNIIYPPDAIEKQIEGTVIVSFLVTEKGKVDEVETVQSVYHSLDMTVRDAIKLSSKRWVPARSKDSLYIASRLQVPFNFQLAERIDTMSNVVVKPIYHRKHATDPRKDVIINNNVVLPEYAELAGAAISNNKPKKAVRLYSKAYRGEPSNPRYLIRKAELLIELEKTDKACKVLRKAEKMGSDKAEGLIQLNCI